MEITLPVLEQILYRQLENFKFCCEFFRELYIKFSKQVFVILQLKYNEAGCLYMFTCKTNTNTYNSQQPN